MNATMQQAIDSAPAGTSGLVIEPWTPGETYGVAADWSQASCPVRVYMDDGWIPDSHGRQVANFRHNPREALESELAEALQMSGDDDADEQAVRLAEDATEF